MVSRIQVVAILLGTLPAGAHAVQAPVPTQSPTLSIEKGTVKVRRTDSTGTHVLDGVQGMALKHDDCVMVMDRSHGTVHWSNGSWVEIGADGDYGIELSNKVGYKGHDSCDGPVAWWWFSGVTAAGLNALRWGPEPQARGTPISSP